METILALIESFGDDPVVTLAVLGVAGGALAAYVVFGFARDRQGLRRRAAAGTDTPEPARAPGKPERPRSLERLVSFIDENIAGDTRQNRVLRRQLIQAGFFDPRAGVGYFLPTLYLRRRVAQRVVAHRMGFPDFMDLMVVCAEAGLSMEAAIERIARELVEGYPSLAENLYMVSLEIRAGKTFADAFERMGERLGIDEAMMLSTLLQQSAELGTSLSNSLRVYSDEMRGKRLSRAEEKAYSLPAKLTVPLILFVFPVLLFVLMLPVVIRFSHASF